MQLNKISKFRSTESNSENVILASTVARRAPASLHMLDIEIHLAAATLARLNRKHPGLADWWKEQIGHDIDTLTEGEAGHLLKAPSLDAIRDRIAAARSQAVRGGG